MATAITDRATALHAGERGTLRTIARAFQDAGMPYQEQRTWKLAAGQ